MMIEESGNLRTLVIAVAIGLGTVGIVAWRVGAFGGQNVSKVGGRVSSSEVRASSRSRRIAPNRKLGEKTKFRKIRDSDSISDTIPEKLRSDVPPDGSRPVLARSLSIVPGALICPDYQTVGSVFHLYAVSWKEKMQDATSGGQSILLRGEALDTPNPQLFNCVLLPPGTTMMLEPNPYKLPIVRVRTSNGWIRGATLAGMAEGY